MTEPTREQLAWAAGWFEGEGSIPRTTGKPAAARISITNTDHEILAAFRALFGDVGFIYPVPSPVKPRWIFQATGEDAIRILRLIYPWLYSRRRARVDELLAARAEKRKPRLCKQCGGSFAPKAIRGGQNRLYCSADCARLANPGGGNNPRCNYEILEVLR